MKNLNKGKIDPMTKAKRLEPKKKKLKKVEIQDEVKIGQYLIEKGDIIFVEMEEEDEEANKVAKEQQMGMNGADAQDANPSPAI